MITERILKRVARDVRKAHPDVIGAGLGFRRKRGKVKRELVLKVYVARKLRRTTSARVKFLPKHWPVTVRKGGKTTTFRLPTDVERVMTMVPTQFDVGPMKAACWLAWEDDNQGTHHGVLTAGHGLPAPGQRVQVDGVATPGIVILKSDLAQDGLDVGVVEVDPNQSPLPPAGWRNPPTGSPQSILSLLIENAKQKLATRGDLWVAPAPAKIRILEYHPDLTVQAPDGSAIHLRNVLKADGPNGAFAQGRSGATWVTSLPAPMGLGAAVQSHGRSPAFNLGLATHLGSGLQWIASHQPAIRDLRHWWVDGP